jgi:two-component system phosphate regulon response regulator OmpR
MSLANLMSARAAVSGCRSNRFRKDVAMKATANYKLCVSAAPAQVVAKERRTLFSHTPRRWPVGPAPMPFDRAAPRLTAPLMDAALVLAPRAPAAAAGHGAGAARNTPRVLHIDSDDKAALVLSTLLMPEASVIHVATVAAARRILATELFSLVVLDPGLSDGDGRVLMPELLTTPLLVYSARLPDARDPVRAFLPKPWTSPRQLWSTISLMLGIAPCVAAGD